MPELRELLANRVTSTEQIEMLLLLGRSPERAWTREEVACAVARAVEPTAMRLFLLSSSGFLDVEGTGKHPRYRYRPVDAATAALGELLFALWAENPRVVKEALALDGDALRARR